MSEATPSLSRRLVKLGAAAAWFGAAAMARPAGEGPRSANVSTAAVGASSRPAFGTTMGGAGMGDDEAEKRLDFLTNTVGYVVALALTLLAFALVYWRWLEPSTALWIVFALAFIQALVHFRCFLHIDFRSQSRDDLQLLLFSAMIIVLMVGGTLVVLANLYGRMM